MTYKLTTADGDPLIKGTSKQIPWILGEATSMIEDRHYGYVSVLCDNKDEIKKVELALKSRFADSGRGIVERRPAEDGDGGYTTFLIDHTDIGSDSENDAAINYDYKYVDEN